MAFQRFAECIPKAAQRFITILKSSVVQGFPISQLLDGFAHTSTTAIGLKGHSIMLQEVASDPGGVDVSFPEVGSSQSNGRIAVTSLSRFLTQDGGLPQIFSGRQRLQGRYPAAKASEVVAKYSTFRESGFAGHEGRQKIPVVRTARKNIPS